MTNIKKFHFLNSSFKDVTYTIDIIKKKIQGQKIIETYSIIIELLKKIISNLGFTYIE